jgi:hypothetical protein
LRNHRLRYALREASREYFPQLLDRKFSLCSKTASNVKEELPMLPENLPFRVIRANSEDEVIARAANLIVGRAAYRR